MIISDPSVPGASPGLGVHERAAPAPEDASPAPIAVLLTQHIATLLEEQHVLLDEFEQDESDPKRLDEMFRIDHLTAQARHMVDGLLLTVGRPLPGIGERPVPLRQLVLAAVARVPGYERVVVDDVGTGVVTAQAAPDLVYVLAELLSECLRADAGGTIRVHAAAVGLAGYRVDLRRVRPVQGPGHSRVRPAEAVRPEVEAGPGLGLQLAREVAARRNLAIWTIGDTHDGPGTALRMSLELTDAVLHLHKVQAAEQARPTRALTMAQTPIFRDMIAPWLGEAPSPPGALVLSDS